MITRDTEATRLTNMMNELIANTEITNLSPGSIARSILEIVNKQIEEEYVYLETYLPMTFLSTATGNYVDLIGALLHVTRNTNESDTNYKYRISNQVFAAAGANYVAIQLACLSVAGVKDVLIVPYAYGIGSFAVYVVTDDQNTSDSILADVQTAIDTTKALGVYGVAEKPKVKIVDVNFSLYFDSTASATDIATTTKYVLKRIKYNLDNTVIGVNVHTDRILSGVIDLSPKLISVTVNSIKVNGASFYAKTITLNQNEKVYAGTITTS